MYLDVLPLPLLQVPGIGPAAVKSLGGGDDPNEKITNTFQLIGTSHDSQHIPYPQCPLVPWNSCVDVVRCAGKFLMLKGPDSDSHQVSCMEHCDKFW